MSLREAAQQALEALEWNLNTDLDNIPVCEQWAKMLKENINALRTALAEPEQEPVAWHHSDCEGECIACLIEKVVQESYGNQGLGYLRRHIGSPQEPLTDEAALKLWGMRSDGPENREIIGFARAIEQAHGIKQEETK